MPSAASSPSRAIPRAIRLSRASSKLNELAPGQPDALHLSAMAARDRGDAAGAEHDGDLVRAAVLEQRNRFGVDIGAIEAGDGDSP